MRSNSTEIGEMRQNVLYREPFLPLKNKRGRISLNYA
jgi:hypothetical protein